MVRSGDGGGISDAASFNRFVCLRKAAFISDNDVVSVMCVRAVLTFKEKR